MVKEQAALEKAKPVHYEYKRPEKFITGLTVAQLASLVDLLYRIGLFKNAEKSTAFRFFTANFRTETVENISYESMRTKSYDKENENRSGLKKMIGDILRKL